MKLWKSMKTGPRSDNGNEGVWKIGEWRKHKGELRMCSAGYHASKNVIDAMQYVNAEVIAQVEVRGQRLEQDDKQCWSEMRIIKAWPWTKEDSVSLAIYAAEPVIDIYEKQHPDDNRPRRAIDAAKKWLNEPTEENRAAAWAAAWADGAAAWAAARAAAWAAARADGAAAGAAWAAAWAAIKGKCHKFVLARLAAKEE